ncbi:acyltransferase family protein [Amycolatopsis magusensis]|uniref:acyltransferase family protein n=1 Tax=Amycolatopsis magusensis TaxID=882444 RepID=UPI0024A9065A|nr:acyltransferase family protein [Amycolatopsis magusensis]MDI5977933.1 acyltransferase family protein [Amycolatopsis magusensis]
MTTRDHTVDALRGLAIAGVVLGHWLVSAVVSDPYQPTALHGESPLAHTPEFAPVTWFLQTLGPFFFAAGYAAASRARHGKSLRRGRLLGPVLALAAVWLPATLLLAAVESPASTRDLVRALVTQPLWFLLVYLVLVALTPVLRPLVVRCGPWVAVVPVALVGVVDLIRLHGLPNWLGVVAAPVAWAVPYLLGLALAEERLHRRAGAVLLSLGVLAGAALLCAARYPASAVGVPGDRWSNLAPPSLFTLALAAAQVGVFLLLRPWLARVLRHRAVWAPISALNRHAMAVYCWHQTALLLVTFTGLLAGRLPGLLDEPTGDWPLHRLYWLPVFALVLAALTWLQASCTPGRRSSTA